MASNPTVIVGHLDDQELKQSISNLVAHVKRGLHTMETDTTNTVQAMQKSLQSLGNLKLDSNSSGDGGSTRRARRQQAETQAVKETEASYDQLLGALKAAQREVSIFKSQKVFTVQDIDNYKDAIARVVELNEKLARSQANVAMSRAMAAEKNSTFDAKAGLRDIFAVDARLKQLNQYYAQQEKLSQREAQNNEKLEKQRLAAIEKEQQARQKLIDSAKRAEDAFQTKTLKDAWRGALTMPTNTLDEVRAKIERITTLTSTLRKEGIIDEAQVNRGNALVHKLNEQLDKQLTLEREIKAEQARMNGGMGRIPSEMRMLGDEKKARESYYAFVQGYREQANQLSQLIRDEESRLLQAQQTRVTALGQNIDQNKAKIQELRDTMKQLVEEEKTASTRYGVKDGYRMAIQQTNDEINKLIAKNKELEQEQQRVSATDPLKQQNTTLDELRAKRERVLNIMKEETVAQNSSTQAFQQQANAAREYSAQVKKIAEEIRSTVAWQKEDKSGFRRAFAVIDGRPYNVAENAKMGIILEEQIEQILKNINDQRQRGVSITQQQTQASQQLSEADKKAAEALGWVTSKKSYVTPTTNIEQIREVRGALQSITRMQETWVGSVDKTTASYYTLSDYIKRLRTELLHLPQGAHPEAVKVLIDEIQLAEREMQKFQRTMARPINLEAAMKGSEKTLDDIAYKIQRLQSYKKGIDLTDPKSANELRMVDAEINRLTKDLNKYMSTTRQATNLNNALARSWNYMKNRLAFYFTVGASTAFIRNLIEVRSQYEMNERALGILVNSAEHGTRIFKELSDMSLISPYTLIELSSAARQLTAYGTAAKDVVDVTRRVADMAAAVGTPIERLTYALGHVQTYGYLTSLQARQFINAGIPIVKELSNLYTQMEGRMVSVADVYDRMKKKAVSYNDVMQVVTSMTDEGGRFFDFQAKMADTLKVSLANLTLAWNNMLNEMGQESQGVLSFGIKTLKQLFLHWRDLNGVINKGIAAFLLYKVYQTFVLANMQALTRTMGWNILIGKTLTRVFIQLGTALKAAFLNPATYVAATVLAFLDLFSTIKQNIKAVDELNDAIRKGAEESSSNIDKYLNNAANKDVRRQASTGSLDTREANKAWESISEEIDTSAASAASLKRELLGIDDVNARVAKSFEYLEQIRSAQLALKDLKDDTIDISQDGWHGVFGEGLVSDLKDYVNLLKDYDEKSRAINKDTVGKFGDTQEFKKELDVTANSIKRFIDVYGIKDPLQIQEILERVRAQIKMKNPEIKGELEKVFDIELDRRMATLTNGAVDQNASLWKMFMDELKRTSSSTFANLTDDIYDQSKNLNDVIGEDGRRAINETLATFKSTMPFYYDAVKNMVADASQLRINIGVAFGVEQDLTSVFEKLTKADSSADEAYKKIQRLQTERDRLQSKGAKMGGISDDDKRYAKTLQELTEAEEDYNKAIAEGGTSKKEDAANKKAQKAAETELQKALKDELQLIDKVRSQYKKLTDAGVDNTTALAMVTNQFDNSIQHINNVLGKNGIPLFAIKTFAGTDDPNMLLKMLDAQLKAAKNAKNVKPVEIKDLEVKYGEIIVDAKSYNYKKITDGLNNELGKIKDEYELAVELDANPELGGMFSNMFNINTADFPHTIDEYMKRVQEAFDTARNEFGYSSELNVFKANEKVWAKWGEDVGLTEDALDKFKSKFVDAQGVAKKWAQDTVNQIQTLRYELIDTNDKLAIEQEKLTTLQNNLAKATNKEQIKLLQLQIEKQKMVIAKLGEEVLQMLPTYRRLFSGIVEHSAWATRQIAEQWKQALESATKNVDDTYTITDPISGEKSTITKKQYGKELERVNDELRKVQTTFEKFNEAFTKGEDNMIDWAQGFSLIASEAEKAAQGLREISSLWESFGYARGDIEVLNDISDTLDSLSSVGKGVGQLMAGDIAGGAVSIISGLGKAIKAWMDNANNRINDSIENSQYRVKKLELAYKDLERAIDGAYGTAVAGAQRAAIENKKLQLAELERQLALEKSRDSKHKDDDAIMSLEGSIKDLMKEIEDSTNSIVANLLDVSSVASAVENMVTSVMDALRKGESGIDAWNESIDEMIYNLVKKFAMTHVIAPMVESAFDKMDAIINKDSDDEWETVRQLQQRNEQLQGVPHLKKQLEENERALAEAKARAEEASAVTAQDIDAVNLILEGLKMQGGSAVAALQPLFDRWGITAGEGETTLSALQQGIQGITEDTAGALEAYMNNVWQNVAVHTDLLTQIRDFMATYSFDVQLGISGQMLMQLQQSYQLQSTIATMLTNWSSPNGMAVRVEMV